MLEKKIFIDYKENGVLIDAAEVVLASFDNSYGVKDSNGNVIETSVTTAIHTSTGHYEYILEIEENKVYLASWRVQVQPGGPYKYAVQEIGPFDGSSKHNVSTELRGVFAQGTTSSAFLRVFNFEGIGQNASDISVTITDSVGNVWSAGIPELLGTGFYVYDWTIPNMYAPETAPVGNYSVNWYYTVDGQSNIENHNIVVSSGTALDGGSLYTPQLVGMRESLALMLHAAQKLPIYRDIPKPTRDNKTFQFSLPRWNQCTGVRVYINKQIQTDNYQIDFNKGTIAFDNALTQYDNVTADYNCRWFKDQEIDRFLSNAAHMLNLYPPVTYYNFINLPERFSVLIYYGAAVDALRSMLLSLMFQEPQVIFGGAEAAKGIFTQMESLKKNYEETWKDGLDQKKLGPYRGLTKMVVVPEYTLPGGRSRWFRMLFSDGGG